jgi:hypothetical protein
MTIALIAFFVIATFLAGYLLWKSADSWRWFHITASAITMILAITVLFPTAVVLRSRSAWHKVKEDLETRVARIEAEQKTLKFGDPLDPAAGQGVLDLQSQLKRYALEAGRRWQNLTMQANAGGTITLAKVELQPELPPGVAPDAADPAAAAPAAPVAPQPMIPQGLVVYGFAESAEPGVSVPVPTFFLGEFRVTASGPDQVTLTPANRLEGPQQQAIASGQARTWTLYELLPLDSHDPFIAPGSEPADDAVFGRVDDALVKRLLAQGVSQKTIDKYLRDGGRAKPDDPPATRWVKVEFIKPHAVVVDSPEQRNVLDGGFFDGTGQAVDSRLQRGEDGTARFKVADQIVVKGHFVFEAQFFERSAAAELDAVVLVDVDDTAPSSHRRRRHLVDAADVAAGQFADVDQSVAAGQDFDERAEVLDAADHAVVDLADLDRGGAGFDLTHRLGGRFAVAAGDQDGAVIIDFDDTCRSFLDAADVLAARADQRTDLVGRSWCAATRCGRRGFATRTRDRGQHLAQDLDPSFARLLQRRADDVFADPGDLQVELDAGDAVLRSGDLEVHVAEVIFVAEDVGQQAPIVVELATRPIEMPATGLLIGTPAPSSRAWLRRRWPSSC